LAALAVLLAFTTLVLAIFAIVAGIAAIWGKNELKTLILAKAAEVAETAANKYLDTHMREQEEKATIKGSVTGSGQPSATPETAAVADTYPGEGE
jgi:type II secretory pathway pseudopilin PulG